MDLSGVINQMLVLLLAVLVGYIAGKRKIMDRDSNRVISKLINYITMPALCLSTVSAADSGLKSSGGLGG